MSASSSQVVTPVSGGGSGGVNRTDQIIHRVYLKTVGVLVDGRLTHYGGGRPGDDKDKKKDKWFNLVIPDIDIHKADLQVYRSISSIPPTKQGECGIPPLLVAFILDTSDVSPNQALLWNRASGRVPIDTASLKGKGKGKETEQRSGIVLERWTFQASYTPDEPSGSQLAPHTAYRMGIIHFRSLYSLLRLLPAYRLFRRLRRANNGLRLGLKLWAPEGYPSGPEGLRKAWEVMEQDLVGLDVGLEALVPNDEVEPDEGIQRYDLPSLDLFGTEYKISVDYKPEVDFQVDDLESVLSEKFVDMDEDWFTPTMARHRVEGTSAPTSNSSTNPPSRRVATPTAIPSSSSSNPAPIPQRQGPASIGSFQSGVVPGSKGRQPSGQKSPDPSVTERWSALGQGLPFAAPTAAPDMRHSPSSAASGAAITARRLSGHSIHPFTSASPSTSYLRSSPSVVPQGPSPTLQSRPSIAHSGSVGRTSSFLSQSGRSFTHAQLANMYPSSGSPPVTGAMSREHLPLGSSPDYAQPPISPSSLSFSKQPLPRSVSGRPPYAQPSGSSPFIPGSLERENIIPSPTCQQPPHTIKRYSSSLSQRAGRVSSGGSSGDPGPGTGVASGSVPGSVGQNNLLRRTSTRESGLRHSHEASQPGASVIVPDNDDIQSFLKTLEALPQPPTLAAQSASSRARLPSTSSSISNPSIPQSPSPLQTSSTGPQPSNTFAGRTPMTRKQVDDALKRMTGSFAVNARTLEQSSVMPVSADTSRSHSQYLGGTESPPFRPDSMSRTSSGNTPSVGLLTASRPTPMSRRVSPASLGQTETQTRPISTGPSSAPGSGPSSLGRSVSVKKNSPLSGAPLQPPATSYQHQAQAPPQVHSPAVESAGATQSRDPDPEAVGTALPPSPPRTSSPTRLKSSARSLPAGPAPLAEDSPIPSRSQRPSGFLSPQPTGSGLGIGSANRAESAAGSVRAGSAQRRGPVLLRGGFEGRPTSQSKQSQNQGQGQTQSARQSVSPSHSPIRDFSRLTSPRTAAPGEDQAVQALGSWKRYRSPNPNFEARPMAVEPDPSDTSASASTRRQSTGAGEGVILDQETSRASNSRLAGQRTAPGSLGRQREERQEGDSGDDDPAGDLVM